MSLEGVQQGHWRQGAGAAPARSFTEAIGACFSRYATFSGRSSRSEFWWFQLFYFLFAFGAGLLSDIGVLVVSLLMLLPMWAVAVRRLHDANMSGWFSLIGLIPFIGLLTIYWWSKAPVDPNNYNV